MKRLFFVLCIVWLVLPLTAQETTPEVTAETSEVERLVPQVVNRYPHDTTSFTQGLLYYDGVFYESSGFDDAFYQEFGTYGGATLRRVDVETGEVLESVELIPELFAEGITLVDDDTLIQLTWRSEVAIVFDRETLEPLELYRYEGEGWGLCYDGEVLYMSNGSDTLTVRDATTFEPLDEFPVTLDGDPVTRLNELECVGDVVYANVWQTDEIMRIDKTSGAVTAVIDASNLLTEEERAELAPSRAVLNGIAYNAEDETFFLTGKWWSHMFEVVFVSADEAATETDN